MERTNGPTITALPGEQEANGSVKLSLSRQSCDFRPHLTETNSLEVLERKYFSGLSLPINSSVS